MELKPLALKDKKVFAEFLNLAPHALSVYAFENIYIWKGLFDIRWAIIRDSLCVFFKDRLGCFLYLSPLTEQLRPSVIEEALSIMDRFNRQKNISRIENIEEKDLPFYERLGYLCRDKFPEYLCPRRNLAQLAGNKFKSKRACVNYFLKHYKFAYLPFSLKYKDACFELYNSWAKEREGQSNDAVYNGMLEDGLNCLQVLLDNYSGLDVLARIVQVEGKIQAFTLGFKLNAQVFTVLYEITNLSIKGLSQFIFREFCRELTPYKYINIMDDSGLENLKRTKLSYHPTRLIPAYIAKRKDGSAH